MSSSKGGQHATTFEPVALILGSQHQDRIDYFDTCRQKRNQVNNDHAGMISDSEAKEIVQSADEFRSLVATWIRQHHPH